MALRKRVYTSSKKIWIYGFGTFSALFIMLFSFGALGVGLDVSGDIACKGTPEDPCVSYFNVSTQNYSICFGSTFSGVYFDQPDKLRSFDVYKADLRFRGDNPARWKPYNFSSGKCLDIGRKHEFKLVGIKKDPTETIKWGTFYGVNNQDPIWFGDDTAPSQIQNNTYQNRNLENDLVFQKIVNSNTSFEINITDTTLLANATFGFNNVNYTETSQQGLVGWYKFNENVTYNLTDYSGYGSNGTLTGGNITSPGKFGNGMNFDRVNDRVNFKPVLNMTLLDDYSYTVWFNGSTNFTSEQRIFYPAMEIRLQVEQNTGKIFAWYVNTSNTGGLCGKTTNSLLDREWHFAAVTHNSTRCQLYVDGVSIGGLNTVGKVKSSAATIGIGANPGSGAGFYGMIDDGRIYNRTLNDTEIEQLWETGNGGGTLNTVYQIPNGNFSSIFFINITTPDPGTQNFTWFGTSFNNNQNKTDDLFLSILQDTTPDFFSPNNTLQNQTIENDLEFRRTPNSNVSFDINITDYDLDLANATLEFNNTNYTETSTTGLVAWWKFNEGSGNIGYDSSGDNNTGNYINNPTLYGQVNCTFGGCLNISGSPKSYFSADRRNNPPLIGVNHSAITVSAWFNASRVNTQQQIIGWRGDTEIAGVYLHIDSSNNRIRFGFGNSSQYCNYINPSNSISANVLTFVTATYGGNNDTAIYINGVSGGISKTGTCADGTSSNSMYGSIGTTSRNVSIGTYAVSSAYWFNGTIDDVRVYNRSLNPTEVLQLYQAGKGGGNNSVVYQFPDGNVSSRFFINLSSPNIGIHNFTWYTADFNNSQNKTDYLFLNVSDLDYFGNSINSSLNNTYYSNILENDGSALWNSGNVNLSFEINLTDQFNFISNASLNLDGVNYTKTSQDGLQAWWKFNRGSTLNITDHSGNGNNMYTNNTYNNDTCKFGLCITFNITNSGSSTQSKSFAETFIKNTPNITLSNFTISLWINPKQNIGSGTREIDFVNNRLTGVSGWLFGYNGSSSNSQKLEFYNGTQWISSGTTTPNAQFIDGTWKFVAVVFNGTHMIFYKDSTKQSSVSNTGVRLVYNNVIRVGSRIDNQFGFNGTIDDVRIYNRALSDSELLELYRTGNGGGSFDTVYQIPDGQNSSTFFINFSNPTQGVHTFNWYASDFSTLPGYFNNFTTPTYSINLTDSCTVPAINNNWIFFTRCTIQNQRVDLGTGNITITNGGQINLVNSTIHFKYLMFNQTVSVIWDSLSKLVFN